MSDGGASTIVLFVASIALAATVSGVLMTSVGGISAQLATQGQALGKDIATDIEIINDPANVQTGPTVLYVKNTGSTTIPDNSLTVLLDGTYSTYTWTLLNGATAFKPTEVVKLEIAGALAAGDHTARVVAPGGHAEDFRFTI